MPLNLFDLSSFFKKKWIMPIVFIFVVLLIKHMTTPYIVRYLEPFCGLGRNGRSCNAVGSAHATCHELAKGNCQIPTCRLNDCWLYNYKKCTEACGNREPGGNPVSCNCHDFASEQCRSNDDPAEACYASVHQKCLSGLGFAKDPDRG